VKSFAAVVVLFASSTVFAQAADDEAPPAPAATDTAPPNIGGEDQLAVFVLHRGFFFSSDLGVFMTLGGYRGYSNVQPYLSLKAGFDINDALSVQAYVAHGYSSGNPISAMDLPESGGQSTVSYGLLNFGGELVYAIRPTERFAIEPRIGGGLTRIYPTLTSPSDPGATLSPSSPHVGGGIDFKYLTLLTDFTAGVSLTGYYIIGPQIPAAAAAFVVRYTF
jgi:hypothetical protein